MRKRIIHIRIILSPVFVKLSFVWTIITETLSCRFTSSFVKFYFLVALCNSNFFLTGHILILSVGGFYISTSSLFIPFNMSQWVPVFPFFRPRLVCGQKITLTKMLWRELRETIYSSTELPLPTNASEEVKARQNQLKSQHWQSQSV